MTQLIEIGSPAFNELITRVAKEASATALNEAKRLFGKAEYPEWVKAKEARQILGCGTTKLQQLRDDSEIEFTDSRKPMYKTKSLFGYLERNKR